MNAKLRERMVVGVAALLFFAAFGAIALFDRSHGSIGGALGQDDFTVEVERNQGHLAVPNFPSDLLIYGAGQDASLDFTITNNDDNNDIDTVYITIPGGEMINTTTKWYDPLFDHQWNFASPSAGVAKISAQDDLPGRVFGGSAQYDVAGNVDDALDHSSDLGISEGITITLDFKAPSTTGVKVGPDAIDLQVADEQTENEGSTERSTVDPFPLPYMVIDTGFEFIIYDLDGNASDLDIDYGGQMLFGTGTRASDFSTSDHGYRYIAGNGDTIIVLEAPSSGTVVDPVISPESDNGGQFTLSMVHYRTLTIDPAQPSSTWVEVVSSQEDYTADLPEAAGETLSLDIDGDGLFTDNDDDIDGDGVPNSEDTSPYDSSIANHRPTVTSVTPSATSISKDKKLEIDVVAADADSTDTLTYTWSVSPDTGWTGSGVHVVVDLGSFDPGSYTFTVLVSDGNGGQVQDSTLVEVTKAHEAGGMPVWLIVLIILVLLVIVGGVIFFVVRGRKKEDNIDEVKQPSAVMEEPVESMDYGAPSVVGDTYMGEPQTVVIEESVTPVDESPVLIREDIVPLPEESGMDKTEEEIGDVCPECGAPLGPEDTSCPNCGAQFDVALECPNCGAIVDENATSCPSCGLEFS